VDTFSAHNGQDGIRKTQEKELLPLQWIRLWRSQSVSNDRQIDGGRRPVTQHYALI